MKRAGSISHSETWWRTKLNESDSYYMTPAAWNDDDVSNVHSQAWLATVPLILSLIIFVTIMGNVFVVLAFIMDPRIRANVANVFILNLAIGDFLIASVILTVNTAWLVEDVWLYGEVFCKFWCALDNTLLTMAVVNILLISWDRLCLLNMGMKYRALQTHRKVRLILAISWTVTAAFYTFLAFAWSPITGEYKVDYDQICEMEYSMNFTATAVINAINFCVPFVLLVVFNLKIFINIRMRSNSTVGPSPGPIALADKSVKRDKDRSLLSERKANGESKDIRTLDYTASPETLEAVAKTERAFVSRRQAGPTAGTTDGSERRFFARHRKAAFVLAILVVCFLVCWLPYQITSALYAICVTDCVSELAWEVTNTILWCNATINPFIYAATNVHFRRNFRHFLFLDRWTCKNNCRIKRGTNNHEDDVRDMVNETEHR